MSCAFDSSYHSKIFNPNSEGASAHCENIFLEGYIVCTQMLILCINVLTVIRNINSVLETIDENVKAGLEHQVHPSGLGYPSALSVVQSSTVCVCVCVYERERERKCACKVMLSLLKCTCTMCSSYDKVCVYNNA